jgi:hypothetical protein
MVEESDMVSLDYLEHVLHVHDEDQHVDGNYQASDRHDVEAATHNALHCGAAVLV